MSVVPEALPGTTPASTTRPTTLTAAIAVAVLTALAAIANAVIILTGGLDLVKEVGNEIVAAELGISEAEVQEALDFVGPAAEQFYVDAQSTFQTRAFLILICGAALLLFGLLMRKAATAMRALVTVAAALTIVFAAIIATDAGTGAMIGLGWAAVAGSLVTIMLTWLPANGRYAKAAK